MLNDGSKAQNELSAVLFQKNRVEKQIKMVQQRILVNEERLKRNAPTTQRYQKAFEEWRALQTQVAELHAQVTSLEEALRDLTREQESQHNPDQLLPS